MDTFIEWKFPNNPLRKATAMSKKLTHEQLEAAFKQAVRGFARLQARQEMMECVIRSIIVTAPPLHSLIDQALHTAKSDMEHRSAAARPENPPEIDADAMALWNVLYAACTQPTMPESD